MGTVTGKHVIVLLLARCATASRALAARTTSAQLAHKLVDRHSALLPGSFGFPAGAQWLSQSEHFPR